jgi:hypothetical protein
MSDGTLPQSYGTESTIMVSIMADVPRQDWAYYEAKTAAEEAAWIRGLTPNDRFALYQDMFRIVWGPDRDPAVRQRLEDWAWQEKLAMRLRFVEAFHKLDEIHRARAATDNSEGCG